MTISYLTNKGKTATHQEDSILIGDISSSTIVQTNMKIAKSFNGEFNILAVSDGIAGLRFGEVASYKTLELLYKHFNVSKNESINKIVRKTQQSICSLALNSPKYSGMGATLAGVCFCKNMANIFNVGDSRVYVFRNNTLQMLSEDHTVARKMVLKGELENQFDCADMYKMLDSAIVANEDADDFEISSLFFETNTNDIFLICTDGLTDLVDDNYIASTLSDNLDIKMVATKLYQQAMKNGGLDNFSLIIAKLD